MFSPLLLEKVVFLSLICVIFAQVLPGIESSNLGVAVGIAIVVVLNALVTEFLYRRGHHWTRIVPGFVATLAINLVIVFADSLLVRTGNDTPRLNTLFFVLVGVALGGHVRRDAFGTRSQRRSQAGLGICSRRTGTTSRTRYCNELTVCIWPPGRNATIRSPRSSASSSRSNSASGFSNHAGEPGRGRIGE